MNSCKALRCVTLKSGRAGLPAEKQKMKPDQPNLPEPFPREPIPPDLLEWAKQTLDKEEYLANVREIEATGGVAFEDFIEEIEARVRAK